MSHRDAFRTAMYVAWLGAITGGVAGIVESAAMAATRTTAVDAPAVVNTSALYVVLWGFAGLVVGLLSWAIPIGRSTRSRELLGSIAVALPVFTLAAIGVNVKYLPTMFSVTSLVFDLLLAAAGLALCWAIYRAWRTRLATRRRTRSLRSPLSLASVALLVALIGIAASAQRSETLEYARFEGNPGGPSVLVLLVDALRADHLGCYGYPRPTSPNLDGLARNGVLFLNAYAQGSRTKEATASMMTSLYPSTHGVSNNAMALPREAPTLMESARRAGYRTAVFSANPLVSPNFGFGRGVDHFYVDAPSVVGRSLVLEGARKISKRLRLLGWLPDALRSLDVLLPMRPKEYPFDGGDPVAMNRALLSWIDEGGDAGFVVYMHYMDTHTPYAPPPPYDELFDPGYGGPKVTRKPMSLGVMLPFAKGEEMPEDEYHNMVAQYDGAIVYFDQQLDELMKELARRGLTENTLVIVTSDHGEEFYDHGGWGHGQSVYNELVKVPLIMWLPDSLLAGVQVSSAIRHVDLLPTILGAVGVEETLQAFHLEGANLWPLLVGGESSWPDPVVMTEVFHGDDFSRAIVDGNLKLIHAKAGARERLMLFDLSNDPGETRDLSGELPDIAESMFADMTRLQESAASRKMTAETTTLDDGTVEKLRALGYVE